jgi:hypothetical protein
VIRRTGLIGYAVKRATRLKLLSDNNKISAAFAAKTIQTSINAPDDSVSDGENKLKSRTKDRIIAKRRARLA